MSNPEDKDLFPPQSVPAAQGPQRAVGPWQAGDGEVYDAQFVEEKSSGFSLRPILYVLFRHKLMICLSFLAVAGAMGWYVAHIPDTYISQGRVLIHGERLGVVFDPLAEGSSMHKADDYTSTFGTEFGILTSRRIAEDVVDALGHEYILENSAKTAAREAATGDAIEEESSLPGKIKQSIITAFRLQTVEPEPRELAVNKVMKNLSALVSNHNSQILMIDYKDTIPARAQKILAKLLEVYSDQRIEYFRNQIEPEFFKEKSENWKLKIAEKEGELTHLKNSLNITSLDNEKELLLTQLNELETRMIDYDLQLSASKARKEAFKSLLAAQKETLDEEEAAATPMNNIDQRMREQLVNLKLQEVDLASRYFDDDPRLQSVREQVTYMENLLSGRDDGKGGVLSKTLNPTYQELKMTLQNLIIDEASIEASKSRLQNEISKAQKSLAVLTSNESRILELQREKQILEEEYIQYAKSEQVAEITQILDKNQVSNLRVIQGASLPVISSRVPRKMASLLLLGCFMGLFLGIALAFVREFIDQSCKTREDTEEKLGLPVLASIPVSRKFVKSMKEDAA